MDRAPRKSEIMNPHLIYCVRKYVIVEYCLAHHGNVEFVLYITTSAMMHDMTNVTKYHEFGASGYLSISR